MVRHKVSSIEAGCNYAGELYTCLLKAVQSLLILRYISTLTKATFMSFAKSRYCPCQVCTWINTDGESSQERC